MHPRNHQAVLKETELHVLAAHESTGIIGFAIQPDLLLHVRMDLRGPAVLQEQVQGFGGVEVITKFAMVADAGERKAVNVAPLPKLSQTAQSDVRIATHQPDKLRSRG